MTPILLALALTVAGQSDPTIDGRTLFALFERYHSAFRDITFLYEGTTSQVARTAGKNPAPGNASRFQGLYAYRNDGATLLDVFAQGQGDRPDSRVISAVLHRKLEILDASPDHQPPVRDRIPTTAPGGPGSLSRQDSPERIFLAYYYPTLRDPAEHELETQGWETLSGHRCLRVRMLRYPRSDLKGSVGGLPYMRLWIDLERDGCPLRYELYRGDDLESRTEISVLHRMTLPSGRALWLPAVGRTTQFVGQDDKGAIIHTRDAVYTEDHWIMVDTVKFDQGLSDSFFSVKKHALVTSDESLRKLQRELEKAPKPSVKKPPADPVSRQKRLDEALAEADRQAKRLEASSAARSGVGWFDALYGGLGLLGLLAIGLASLWYWKSR